jgi:hypothetical protein
MKLKKTLESAKLARRGWIVLLCVVVTLPVSLSNAQESQPAPSASSSEVQLIPSDQLDSLVAPIALYPDPLLAQVLAASTYPLEIIQLQQWLAKNPDLKDEALADAVMQQPWDPSVQAMANLPDVVNWLADDIQWTTDLGNAFLAQQSDVMDAVQRMRKKADEQGNLESGEQIKVETQVVESKEVIIIEQSNPQVVYVPSYNPVVVYGPPVYPYPPIYYPPPGYYAGAAISFGIGIAIGAAWGGGWGWGCGWGHNDVNININNSFNRNTNINRDVNRGGGGDRWQHNPSHRGGAPYADRATASKYGGNARGDSLSSRQANARQQASQRTGTPGGTARGSDRSAYTGRSPAPGTQTSDARSGSADRVGNRDLSRPAGSSSRSAMGSGQRSGGYDGTRTRSSASRGASSVRSRGGGARRR